MVRIQFPGQSNIEGAAIAAAVRNGILAEVRSRDDLARLIDLCGEVGFSRSWPINGKRRLPEDFHAEPFSQLIGALVAGALSSSPVEATGDDPDQLEERVLSVNPLAERPFDGLLIALTTLYQLWKPDDDLVLLLALALPGDRGSDEVALDLSKPHAALWMAPGSLLAGLSFGTAIKVTKWGALAVKPFTSITPEAASKRLVNRLRDLAQAASIHPAFPRLDALVANDSARIHGRPVLIVLLHGLFSTDLRTFDGFITQLQNSTPVQLQNSLAQLQGIKGIEKLSATLNSRLTCERLSSVKDSELKPFIEANVGLLGWPHDTLVPIATSAFRLAVLLDNELESAPPRHIVFVCHSQGGLLARETALQLKQMQSSVAWADRIGGIVTFGTPHDGASIAEPGFKGGQEAAVYLMMLNGTKQVTSISDVLTILEARGTEGIEGLKPFNASTPLQPESFVAKLLKEEKRQTWPNGKNWPDMLIVGGKLGQRQRDSWGRNLAAGFVSRKLGHSDHDLVVDLDSSTLYLLNANVTLQVESDHFNYFDGQGNSKWAVDAAVALVWTLLAPEISIWCNELAELDKRRSKAVALRIGELKRQYQTPPPPKAG